MAAIPLIDASIASVKKSLCVEFEEVRSSHLLEALASSMGFRTYASMRAAMIGPELDRPFVCLNSESFTARLVQLGYLDDPEFDFEALLFNYTPPIGMISTMPLQAYEIEYKTIRQKAWRNLMVCAVNAALQQKLFTLRPGEDRYSHDKNADGLFDFVMPNGTPGRGCVSDAGYHEVSIHAALNPKGDWVRAFNAGFSAGDAFGTTWIERERGAWMQSSDSSFNCRKSLLEELASLTVQPQGYGDRGRVIL